MTSCWDGQVREPIDGDIGEPKRHIEFEPMPENEPLREPGPAPAPPVPVRAPERVPEPVR